jgi:hypothetical protein
LKDDHALAGNLFSEGMSERPLTVFNDPAIVPDANVRFPKNSRDLLPWARQARIRA